MIRNVALMRGFVLPLTIWILVAVSVVAAFLAERVQKSLQLAQSRQRSNDMQIALSDARAETLFRLGTQPITPRGLGVGDSALTLDNRLYAAGQSLLQLQDARGLLNLDSFADEQLDRLLQGYGVALELRTGLVDALRDYIDTDSLRRLNGAEAAEYTAAGKPVPPNAPLRMPLEVRAVLGWADVPVLWKDVPITEYLTVGTTVALNPNTAPLAVLKVLDGITPDLAQALIARRQVEPVGAELLDRMVGGGLMRMPAVVISFPSDNVRVTQRAPGLPWSLRYNVVLTPRDNEVPWRITYFHRLERPTDAASAANPPVPAPLPPRPAMAASSAFTTPFRPI